jgi:hypothetical protein
MNHDRLESIKNRLTSKYGGDNSLGLSGLEMREQRTYEFSFTIERPSRVRLHVIAVEYFNWHGEGRLFYQVFTDPERVHAKGSDGPSMGFVLDGDGETIEDALSDLCMKLRMNVVVQSGALVEVTP